MNKELTQKVKIKALENGADLVGIVKVINLRENTGNIEKMLPSAQSVVVVATAHSLASISSGTNELAQFDTIHTYNECSRSAHISSRFLESEGYPSAAVPAFIPLDMDEPGKGMLGELCWRNAAVNAGLGSYGENGLLVTEKFGSAVRISGLVTEAELISDEPVSDDLCDHCMRCIEICPVKALSGNGKVNKKKCGNHIFQYGFRFFKNFMEGLADSREDINDIIDGYELRELWQTFMTGNYYYCFKCQTQCHRKDK